VEVPAASEPDVPATLGDFAIEGVLGRGGSGIVYAAKWGPRRVALKVLHEGLVGTGKERAQFLAEAQRLQQIAHPSVVKVFAVGELPDGRPYLAMERLDGETLGHVLSRGALPLASALELFGELCAAVGALHDQALIHRDLKPENVYVVGGRHAVLLDFGIAKEIGAPASTTTQDGAVRGTPAYMAPERFFGQPASIATDVYELAVILYAMVSGRLPWDDLADPEARLQPRPLSGVPETLDVEIRRALSTRAQNRPANAAALVAAVAAAANGDGDDIEPNETARMRPPTKPPVVGAASATPGGTPEQQTPLAWAPTQAAPQAPTPKASRRWIYIAAAAGVVAVGVTTVALRVVEEPKAGAMQTKITGPGTGSGTETRTGAGTGAGTGTALADDPWNRVPAEVVAPTLPLVDGQLTPETYRAEAVAGVQRLPADTRLIFSVQIGELRRNANTAPLLDKLAHHPKIAEFSGVLPPCVRSLIAGSEWLAFGAASIDGAEHATMVLRGRWGRQDVENCFGDNGTVIKTADGARLIKISEFGWLDFIDEHTAYLTNRDELDAAAVHALVRHGAGPQPHARDLIARLPLDRTIAFVADGGARDAWDTLDMPKGTDVFGWIRVDKDGLVLDLAADPHTVAAANKAVATLQPQLTEMFGTSSPDTVGRLAVVRDNTVVHMKGNVTSIMMSLFGAAI
jgi:serine/threonine-protein kinase